VQTLTPEELLPWPQNVRTGQTPLLPDCGRLLRTAPKETLHQEHRVKVKIFFWRNTQFRENACLFRKF